MAVTTKKLFPATSNATTTVFSPVGIQLNNQDDLDVYVTLSGGTRVLQLRQSTGSTAQSSHPQVNNTDGLYFPAVSAGTTLYNYQLSTDNNTITFNSALPQGAVVFCERRTRDADSSYTTFASGSTIRATDLNNSSTESNFTAQDGRNKALTIEGVLFRGDQPSTNFVTSDHIVAGTIVSGDIADGTIVNADVNASAAIAGTKVNPAFGSQNISTSGTLASGAQTVTGNITVSGTVDGRDMQTDGAKLDGIETAATADQTAAEIRTLVESASDSNVFTDADHTKLNGIETAATADQTAAEIRTLVESASDSNVFTDADHTKLNNIEANADVTDATNVNAAGAVMNSDLATKGTIIVGDGSGDPTILGVGSNNMVLVADSSEAAGVKWATVSSASGFNNVVEDATPQLGGNLDVQTSEITTSTTNGNVKLTPNGTGAIEVKGAGGNDGTLQLNCSQNSHGVKIKSPAHSAAQSYTLTLPATNPSSLNNSIGWLRLNSSGELQIDPYDYVQIGEHINMGAFDINFTATGGLFYKSDNSNANNSVGLFGPSSIPSSYNLFLPTADGSSGQFLKTDGSGQLSFSTVDTNLVSDTSPQLGGELDTNGNAITFGTGVGFDKKTGATNAVVNGVTQHVQQGSLIIDGGNKDIFFTGGSQGSKFTFGSSDGATHEVMRITPSVLGASQHGKVNLNYVTANAGGNTGSANRLETTSTGMTFTGVIVPAADSTHDLGTDAVRWRNIYADTLYGDGSNLTGLDSTTAGGAIYENSNTISQTHTIPSGSNGMSAGPVSVSNGVTLTISSGSTYTIV